MGEKEIMAAASTASPDDDGATQETARLRESIAETRESIGNTIDALQEKLNPGVLKERARTAVREATIGKVEDMIHETEQRITRSGHSLYDSMRQHPVPLMMAGFGVAWFVAGHRRDRVRLGEQRVLRDERITSRYRGGGEEEELHAREGTERVAKAAREARDTVRRTAHEVGERGRRLEGRLERLFHDNPLAAGAIALAVGAAVGLAIPISHKEEEWLGPARDRLVGKANELAHEALGKVEEAAEKIEEAAGGVQDVAQDVAQGVAQARGEPGATQQGGSQARGIGR